MGNESSKGKSVSYHNISSGQLAHFSQLFPHAKKSGSIEASAFLKSYGSAGPLPECVVRASGAANSKSGTQVNVQRLLHLVDAALGGSDDKAQVIQQLGDVNNVITAVTETCCALGGWCDAGLLCEYFRSDLSSPARVEKWICSQQLFSALVDMAFGESHGSSFSQMCQRTNDRGPCIVVVRTESGRIFGCFASQGFVLGPHYRGDATCFLFTVLPQLRIFSPTGYTKNYAYLNSQQQSLPNGMGIGGYDDVWPFFINETFSSGISRSGVSSFEKCHLAGADTFRIESLEVWSVGDEVDSAASAAASSRSIIDKDPEMKAILEMAGKKLHSDGYREPKEEDE